MQNGKWYITLRDKIFVTIYEDADFYVSLPHIMHVTKKSMSMRNIVSNNLCKSNFIFRFWIKSLHIDTPQNTFFGSNWDIKNYS